MIFVGTMKKSGSSLGKGLKSFVLFYNDSSTETVNGSDTSRSTIKIQYWFSVDVDVLKRDLIVVYRTWISPYENVEVHSNKDTSKIYDSVKSGSSLKSSIEVFCFIL